MSVALVAMLRTIFTTGNSPRKLGRIYSKPKNLSTIRNQIISESDLIKGCLADERRMQEELYRRFSPRMYGVCLRYAGNVEEAEDILQEGFIKVYKKLNSYRGEGSFEGWIRRIFVNTAIEHFRRKTYQQPITEQQENTVEGRSLSVLDSLGEKDILKLVQDLSP